MRIIISLLVIVFSLHSCKEIPITPLNITKSLTLIGEKQVTNNSFGYSNQGFFINYDRLWRC